MAENDTSKTTPAASSRGKSLAPAGEASDPAVHQLLADLETARLNQRAVKDAQVSADKRVGNEQKVIDEKTARLKELGYHAE